MTMFQPTTVRMKKQFLRFAKGAVLVVMTARTYSFMYATLNLVPTGPTGRFLTERRTDEVAATIEGPSCAAVGKRVVTEEECKAYADGFEFYADDWPNVSSGCIEIDDFDVIAFNRNTNAVPLNLNEKVVCLPFTSAVNGDPLFLGIQGQIFKFDGKSDAWYANLSSESVQWNMQFKKFETCPKDEDMFITRMGLRLDSKNKVSVGVVDEEIFLPGCADGNVCLGEGSLFIEINDEVFHSPGEYKLANNAGRVVVHNTYASCSRKWYDYDTSMKAKHSGDSDKSFVNIDHQVAGMDLLHKNMPNMLDVEDCHSWMEKREQNEDLFLQNGGWSTIYIETTDISLHMEYRQDDETCNSHLIDAWISKVSPELLEQEWSGILGETRYPKYDPNGKLIKSDRKVLLAGHDDVDYEVASQYETNFNARKVFSVDPSIETE